VASPVQASLTTALAGTNNDLVFTSKWNAGKTISVVYLDPGAAAFAGAVEAQDDAGLGLIVVVLKRTAGAITMTGNEVIAAIRANPVANSLVGVDNAAANDGTGAVIALALTALSGGVDPTFATQGEAETKFRSVEPWGVGGIYHSEHQVNGTMQRIRSTDSEANHRARLNDAWLYLARRGQALNRV
jgi:hypothetical protein